MCEPIKKKEIIFKKITKTLFKGYSSFKPMYR